jgi:hypothetical protein
MKLEQLVRSQLAREAEVLRDNLLQFHSVRHKSLKNLHRVRQARYLFHMAIL